MKTGEAYVHDLTCIVRRKARRRWFEWWLGEPRIGDSTVICGRATVEQYLRQGYAFDWIATDAARSRDATPTGDKLDGN